MTKSEELAQPDIPEDALIGTSSRPFIRLRGSHSSQQEIRAVALPRRRPQDDGGPDGDPTSPPDPPPLISTPDLAIQIVPCLEPLLEGALVDAIRQALRTPNADVRAACINGVHRIGIWIRPSLNQTDSQARNRGLQRLDFIKAGETLAVFVNTSYIRSQAADAWEAVPKRRSGDGYPQSDGPIHLTSIAVDFESPNRVITRIGGFDETPWPDVDFQLIITDTLYISGDQVHSESQRKLDADTGWLDFLAVVFLLVVPPLGAYFLGERIIIGGTAAPDIDAGAGGLVAAGFPHEILIPLGLKVVSSYSRVELVQGAIVAGGSFMTVERMPLVWISGPSQVSVVVGKASVAQRYSVTTHDLRPPLQFEWSGAGVALAPHAETTNVRFSVEDAEEGDVLTRRVAVRVTDVDNKFATNEMIVSIYVISEVDAGDLPPICRIKPWLPQCQV